MKAVSKRKKVEFRRAEQCAIWKDESLAPTPENKRGRRTQAKRGSDTGGIYSSCFSDEELARYAEFVKASPTLDDEIWLLRVVAHRLASVIFQEMGGDQGDELTLMELVKAAEASIRCAGRIAHLLKDKRALTDGGSATITEAIGQALDELSAEWGVNL